MRAEGPQGMVLHANYTCLGARARMPPRPSPPGRHAVLRVSAFAEPNKGV